MHKTASSSLQNIVFNEISDMVYVGKSRYIQAMRSTVRHHEVLSYLSQIPDHIALYHFTFLLDRCIATLPRLPRTAHEREIQTLKYTVSAMRRIKAELEQRHPNTAYLYSSEGMLLNMNHIFPDHYTFYPSITIADLLRKVFKGDDISTMFYYRRAPIEYLYSRYIQIHTIRLQASNKGWSRATNDSLVLSPKRFFQLNDEIWQINPYDSMYINMFPSQLTKGADGYCQSIKKRSYEQHILGNCSITSEIEEVLGVCYGPNKATIDLNFRNNPINTTARDKDSATSIILQSTGHSKKDNLKEEFISLAEKNYVVQQAVKDSQS